MTGCAEPGDTIFYSTSNNLKRKYPLSWELTKTAEQHTLCVNTIRANQLIEEAINNNVIKQLTGYSNVQREVKYGDENSKIDFFLSGHKELSNAYVEVKSVTLLKDSLGYFPDAVSVRGQKHLRELMAVAQKDQRAVLVFAVLHSGISSVQAAKHIDPQYSELLKQAVDNGVEVIVYKATLSPNEMLISSQIPFIN